MKKTIGYVITFAVVYIIMVFCNRYTSDPIRSHPSSYYLFELRKQYESKGVLPTKENVVEMMDARKFSFQGGIWRVEGTNNDWILVFEPLSPTIWQRLWLAITRWEIEIVSPRPYKLSVAELKSWSDNRMNSLKESSNNH